MRPIGLLLILLGCPPATEDTGDTALGTGCFANAAAVTIGTGSTEWEDLDEGDGVMMVHGPQGGWHMLASARVHNMLPIVRLHYTITDLASGSVVSNNTYDVALTEDTECSGHFTGMYGYIDVRELKEGDADTPPELLSYNDVKIRIEASDKDGHQAVGEIVVVATPDPRDE
jgi:hypothetical protein